MGEHIITQQLFCYASVNLRSRRGHARPATTVERRLPRSDARATAYGLLPINAEGEELVIPAPFHTGSRVAGTPVDRAVHDGGASIDRAPGTELPQNRAGRRVECEHLVLIWKLGHR